MKDAPKPDPHAGDLLHIEAMLQMIRAETLTLLALLNAWSKETGQKVAGSTPGDWFWEHYVPNLMFLLDKIAEHDPEKARALRQIIESTPHQN